MPKKSEKKTEVKEEKAKQEKLTQKEFEKRVIELAGKGMTCEKIGETLRKQGIHPGEYEKKISRILKENNSYVNPDIKNIETKLEKIKKHSDKNKQDKKAKREKERVFSQLRNLKIYFKIPTR
jgi:ribosomal protein S15P/S13E